MRHWAIYLIDKWQGKPGEDANLELFDVVAKDSDGNFLLNYIVTDVNGPITSKSGQVQNKPNNIAVGVQVEWDDTIDGDLSYLIEGAADEYDQKNPQNNINRTKLYLQSQ